MVHKDTRDDNGCKQDYEEEEEMNRRKKATPTGPNTQFDLT